MPTLSESLAIAQQHQRNGNLQDAEQLYQQILRGNPNCGEALHLLGGIAQQSGRKDLAAEYTQRAADLLPQSPAVLSDLATAYQVLGRFDEAIATLRKAIKRAPNVEALHFNLGNVLHAQGKKKDAIAAYRRAIGLKPDFAPALCNLAACLHEQGQFQEALLACRECLAADPNNANGYTILGNVFQGLGKLKDAADSLQHALAIQPNLVQALASLAAVFVEQDKLSEAVGCCQRALGIRPNYAIAYANLGAALQCAGQLDDAVRCIHKALELDPANPSAHLNQSALLLIKGDFDQGWPQYEWRWKTNNLVDREFAIPKWEGQPLTGKTILIHAEQGLGDTIQFIRYAPLVKQLGPTVVVECQKPLMNLLATCRGIDRLVAFEDDLPPADFHLPLLSLPGALKTSLETIPADVPYLSAREDLVQDWRARLKELSGFRIGINWHGRFGISRRDIPLDSCATLAQSPGVRLVNLQKGASAEELAALGGPSMIIDPGNDIDTTRGAFMDTAAIMKNLDLVITSDTSIAHLAGALGVPVWVALPFVPDWRWLLDRTDSPWYPTMRLFRQKSPGDWTAPFAEIKEQLQQSIAAKPTVG